MSKSTITIRINGQEISCQPGENLIDVAEKHGTYIPRFCYHKKLSSPANCRMCLVDVEGAPKTLPACITPVRDGMVVDTLSDRTIKSQQAVLEFLLINHPLDCPVCDQGGECDLQDLSMAYAQNDSRFFEGKRAVVDEDLGPLIATHMTRCIQCTRCVRFGDEIAGIPELGVLDRSGKTRIGTYLERGLKSELSGNMIDVCPVGALTAKPSRFKGRSWTFNQFKAVSVHDCVGSNLYLHALEREYGQDDLLMRVLPRANEAVNEVWISDRDRFSFDALESKQRILKPMIKVKGQWQELSWAEALKKAVDTVRSFAAEDVGALISPTATTEECYLLQKMMRQWGIHHIDHRLREVDFQDQNDLPMYPHLSQNIADIENSDTVLLIGYHGQQDYPMLNHRVRKASLQGAQIYDLHALKQDYNFNVTASALLPPQDWAQYLQSLLEAIEGKKAPAAVKACAKQLLQGQHVSILCGASVLHHPQASLIRSLAAQISAAIPHGHLGLLSDFANGAGAWIAGAVPHRGELGRSTTEGKNTLAQIQSQLKCYWLHGIDAENDFNSASRMLEALDKSDAVIAVASYASPQMLKYATLLLPLASYAENEGSMVNIEGRWQTTSAAIAPPGKAKKGWQIYYRLGQEAGCDGFDSSADGEQISCESISAHLRSELPLRPAYDLPKIEMDNSEKPTLMRLAHWHALQNDPVVRRSHAMQACVDKDLFGSVALHSETAHTLNIAEGEMVRITQNRHALDTRVKITDRVAKGCCFMHHDMHHIDMLGQSIHGITIKKVGE